MANRYTIPLAATSVSTAVDLLEYLAASGKPFTLEEVNLSQSSDYGDAQAEGLQVLIKKGTGSYTSGSGGSTATPAKHATNSPSAGATAEIFNTTQASAGSGTLTTIRPDGFNVQGGYQYLPVPEHRLDFQVGEVLIISLSAPGDSITLLGSIVISEP